MRIYQLRVSPVKGSNHMFSTAKHFIVTHNVIPEPPRQVYRQSMMDMSLEDLGRFINGKKK